MTDRVSMTIVLCEDEAHERLARAYLKRCNYRTAPPYLKTIVASRMQHGGNCHWVLNEFPRQLHACRQRQRARASTLLIVMLDADGFSVVDRRQQLMAKVESDGLGHYRADEPAALLIPKRHVETWIRSLCGEAVSEEENCKSGKALEKVDFQHAAHTLFEWSRASATPGPTCVPSLIAAFADWKKIG